jgi:hypothetical protein
MKARRWQCWALCLGTIILLGGSGCASTGAGAGAAGPPVTPPTSAQAGGQTIIAIAPPPAPQMPQGTLLDFLGINQIGGFIDQTFRGIGRLVGGLFPKLTTALASLEPPPLPLSLTDPANLEEGAPPAASAAASVKAQEDAAAQKIQAIKYLAKIGCNSKYPEIEDGFLEALNDPTEEVRLAAAVALRTSSSDACKTCQSSSCCSPRIREVLDRIANQYDDQGCPFEPSSKVRREARLALRKCGGPGPPTDREPPIEGPIPAQEELPITHASPDHESRPGMPGQRPAKTVSLADVLSSGRPADPPPTPPASQILTISFEEIEHDSPAPRPSARELLNE